MLIKNSVENLPIKNFHIISNKFSTRKKHEKMSSEALDKTVITENWQIFSKKLFQDFIHHKNILKVKEIQFKINCRSRVLDKNIPPRYIVTIIQYFNTFINERIV